MQALVVLLLSGCSVVFPLRDKPDDDAPDAMPDTQAPDTPPPRCPNGSTATLMILPAVADTIISSGAVTQNYGGLGVATVSTDLGPQGSHGLFRFQPGPLEAVDVLELRLVLPSALTSNDCGAGCGSCAGIEKVGGLRAFPVSNAWVETQASWNRASSATAWQQPGASGATDRGAEMAQSDHQLETETSFVATELEEVLVHAVAGQLSFLVESSAGKQVVRTRENTCDGGASGARLEILRC